MIPLLNNWVSHLELIYLHNTPGVTVAAIFQLWEHQKVSPRAMTWIYLISPNDNTLSNDQRWSWLRFDKIKKTINVHIEPFQIIIIINTRWFLPYCIIFFFIGKSGVDLVRNSFQFVHKVVSTSSNPQANTWPIHDMRYKSTVLFSFSPLLILWKGLERKINKIK